jgi:hypothetical protein
MWDALITSEDMGKEGATGKRRRGLILIVARYVVGPAEMWQIEKIEAVGDLRTANNSKTAIMKFNQGKENDGQTWNTGTRVVGSIPWYVGSSLIIVNEAIHKSPSG